LGKGRFQFIAKGKTVRGWNIFSCEWDVFGHPAVWLRGGKKKETRGLDSSWGQKRGGYSQLSLKRFMVREGESCWGEGDAWYFFRKLKKTKKKSVDGKKSESTVISAADHGMAKAGMKRWGGTKLENRVSGPHEGKHTSRKE